MTVSPRFFPFHDTAEKGLPTENREGSAARRTINLRDANVDLSCIMFFGYAARVFRTTSLIAA